ncbi:SCO family protein [Billgrantia diversa]|uniref:SCO family protein n=1 Tax=Halomonas sp. MCCC 1A13316 TaxID=2733487 RepID=UPI001E515D65|nr:SCO family protein [Halomonas sp. MCCC 1A13316]
MGGWFALGALLSGCSDPGWQTKDISGLMPPLEFQLTGESGEQVDAQTFRGDATLLFFGFTHCHDVCPATMAHLDSIMGELDEEARDDLQVLFVSVDPARDDPETLREYTENFGPEFVGLTGSEDQLDALTRRYRVTYGYGEKDSEGYYMVSHPSAIFAFARNGEAQLLIRQDDEREDVLSDLRRLLAQG